MKNKLFKGRSPQPKAGSSKLEKQTRYRPKKRLGQNFLRDRRILESIVEAAALGPEDFVLEIGPGEGELTAALAQQAGQVIAVEIDDDLIPRLQTRFAATPNVTILHKDFLDVTWEELEEKIQVKGPRKVVANIPYYITSPILMKLLDEETLRRKGPCPEIARFEQILIMVQKEVADRMIADPTTKDFGSLSVIVQYAAEVTQALFVPRTAFYPRPQVDSAVVKLVPRHEPPVAIAHPNIFWRIVNAIYKSRRKTLRNSLLIGSFERSVIESLAPQWDLQRRGETFGLAELAGLSDALAE